MTKPVIKNIMWDVDGVLANLDHAYYRFLTEHENYKDDYKDLKWEDLPKALPIDPKFGSLRASFFKSEISVYVGIQMLSVQL